jgi:biotin-dependent carboxylase-like uncharacterized protein
MCPCSILGVIPLPCCIPVIGCGSWNMASLIVRAAPAGATVQDAGRPGWLSSGVPPSGPLDPTAHAAANLAVGNEPRAAALEIPLGALRIAAVGALTVSVDGEDPRQLADGEELTVSACERAVRYLAVAGGIDVPEVLGSRATLLAAALGGLEGRPVRVGDVLATNELRSERAHPYPTARPTVSDPSDPAILVVSPGPHLRRFPKRSWDELLETTWHVSARSDRVGTRLDGAAISRHGEDRAPPAPMVRGAIQITTDGTPIVLGPDHPVTGGYPVLAVVGRASQSLLARLRPKRALRFELDEVGATGR